MEGLFLANTSPRYPQGTRLDDLSADWNDLRYADSEQISPNHALNRGFLDYCRRNVPIGKKGRRADFGPEQLSAFMGNIMIVEYCSGRSDYRYRLYGTGLARISGFDLTNRWHSEFSGDVANVMRRQYDACRSEERVLYTLHEAVHKAQHGLWEQVLCPVVAESASGAVDQIIATGVAVFKQ